MKVSIKLAGFLAMTLAGALGGRAYLAPAAPAIKGAAPQVEPADTLSFLPGAPQLSSLRIAALPAVPLAVSERLNGRIAYDENRTARISAPIAGRVTGLHAEPGDRVGPGFVLAVIDAPELATAEADWRKARADELRKRLAFERAQTLYDGEVLARKDFEAADADYQQARAETVRAALRMRNLHARGDEQGSFALRSPIGGVVADKQINPGQEVRPDLAAPLFIVSDLRQVWLLVDVPERSAAAIRPGQPVSLESDAYPGERFSARVERVGVALDPVTRRIPVRCVVDNASLRLKPEMFVRAAFLAGGGGKTAIALPNTSLFVEGIYDVVFVESRPGVFVKRRVHLAQRGAETSQADIGLAGGERVVTEGAFLLNAEAAANAR